MIGSLTAFHQRVRTDRAAAWELESTEKAGAAGWVQAHGRLLVCITGSGLSSTNCTLAAVDRMDW